jgi:hypothetical protein
MNISEKDGSDTSNEHQTSFSWEVMSVQDSKRLEVISLLFDGDETLLRFLFNLRRPELRKTRSELLLEAQRLGTGERILIEIAMDTWDREGRFSDVFNKLDGENLVRLVRAICHLKEIRNEVMHALIDDENGGFCL